MNYYYHKNIPNLNVPKPLVPQNMPQITSPHDFPTRMTQQKQLQQHYHHHQHQQHHPQHLQNQNKSYANTVSLTEPIDQMDTYIPTENESQNINYSIKFKSNKKIPEVFNDYFYLEEYLNMSKPDNKITSAFINKDDELIMKFKDEKQSEYLRDWPHDAFSYGIKEIIKEKKYYLALHNVNLNFDVSSEKVKSYLKEKYKINDTLRMIKKSTNEKLTIVKAVMSDTDCYNQIIKEGFITIGQFSRIKVTPWRFGINPEYLEQFGINCNVNHAAVSKSCPVLIEAVKTKTKDQEEQALKISKPSQFYRVESEFKKSQYDPNSTTNILKFIIELVMNLNEITKAVHGDPKPLLKIINQNFGSVYSNLIYQFKRVKKLTRT
ncbi:unnamed protein product [Brachionus calyciflorus]|uniref:Uncharacterized protein n=1 Tax=Brachionus calyciflorus TaxID=104777 RepID=A0A814P5K6_9BILA|nr:unnamed protein product [Brachionus calyciflorus]